MSPCVPGEIILKFKRGVTERDRADIYARLKAARLRTLGWTGAELLRVERMSIEDVVRRYRSDPKIEYVEPNYIIESNEIPDDPRFSELYGLDNTGQTGGTVDADIDAPQAWDVFTGSSDVLIGVIDTGVDYAHPDLAANIWSNPGEIPGNGLDDDGNGYVDDVHGFDFVNRDGDPMDDNGHGTHCAGTIGGVGNNGIGVTGVAWNGGLMALKILGPGGTGNIADAMEAIDYATRMGVRVTSNSWGTAGFSEGLLDAIERANAADILFVAAAGNTGTDTDVIPNYPSAYGTPNILAVMATDHNDEVGSFSNYGAISVDLAAPGVNILSTKPGSAYQVLSGTSMAAPHVAGTLALVLGRFPNIRAADAKNLILNAVDPRPALAGKCVTGGRLNAFAAIAEPDENAPGAIDDLRVTATTSNGVTLEWTAPGDDGTSGQASSYVVKRSLAPIDSTTFDGATTVSQSLGPGPAGTSETLIVGGLSFETTYFFAVKAQDEFGNRGLVSNSPGATTLGIPDIAVTPTALNDTLTTGDSVSLDLMVTNVGFGNLDFTIAIPDLVVNAVQLQAFAQYDKDEVDPRVGDTVIENRGGPDGFGYRWVDSDEPFGPAFVWNDISSTGTPIIPAGDEENVGPLSIGFHFPFYGAIFDSIRVSSNGWVSFSSPLSAYLNQPLPNLGAPPNLIAPFWDDLVVGAGGCVYYERTASQLIVQWNNVLHYNAGGPYSFQAVLHENGTIDFYYASMSAPLSSATVGLQNGFASDGLNIVFNAPYLHSNMAIRIVALPQWVNVTPSSGSLLTSDNAHLDVHLNAAGLLGGTYAANVRIQSNDPDEPVITVPVTLDVVGTPGLLVTPASCDFGPVYVHTGKTLQVVVQNPGTGMLHVTQATVSDTSYSVLPAGFNVPPRSSQIIAVTFHPSSVGSFLATLDLTCDDPNDSTVSIPLSGQGVAEPAFSVIPAELDAATTMGEIRTRDVILRNTGATSLNYTISLDLGTETLVYSDHTLEKGEEEAGPGILGAGGPDAFGYFWRDSDALGGPRFNWVEIGTTGTPVTSLTGDDQNAGPIPLGFDFPFYGTSFNAVQVSTNGFLSFTSTSTEFSNAALPTGGNSLPENLIAPFWDDLHFHGVQRARYLADGSKFILQYTGVDRVPPGSNLTFEVILYPKGTIDFQYMSMTGILNSATIGIQNGTRSVGLTVVHNATYVHDNLAVRIQSSPDWFSASPLAGTISPGEEQTVRVILNASNLFLGRYEGGIEFTTSDPLLPFLRVPVLLQVNPGTKAAAADRLPVADLVGPGVGEDDPGNEIMISSLRSGSVPSEHRLYQNYPNPFRSMTQVRFDLPAAGEIGLRILDLRGREVRVLTEGFFPAGRHELTWDARDGAGHPVASGIYFMQLEAGAFRAAKRLYVRQ